ncbi:MAG TPA: Nramp family divalent metal transporter, partial [Rhodothermales bacterium]|nr:Nramp family divalent metal transporter [Rhodothermales bacterium]
MPPSAPAAQTPDRIRKPPTGLAMLLLVGPSIVWCAEYIGSGEVILATRTGAVLGTSVIWAIVAGIFLKYWIGMSGARYTVCTGEGMIDMFARIPGPTNWVVWIVLVAQLISAAISIGSIASAASIFVHQIVPIQPYLAGWILTILAVAVVWSGTFDRLKIVMTILVAVTVLGVLYVAVQVSPGAAVFFQGLVPQAPEVPAWAVAQGARDNPWREILPLLGWGAGGFASQVWYTYWVLGAGYGAAAGRDYGQPADTGFLKNLSRDDAHRIKGWCRVVYTDATLAMVIGTTVTLGFLLAGVGVLGAAERLPEGSDVAIVLSEIFSTRWGTVGGFLFILGGATALFSTQIGQLAGWPRLLADTFRLCFPAFNRRWAWKTQFRLFLGFFLLTNMVIVYTLGLQPVFLVKMGAVLDGLLLTPLQAIWVGIGLYVVLPRLISKETWAIVRPHW